MCDHHGVAPTRQSARTGAQSVERALAVLRCFESATGDLGVSEIAGLTGLSVSTAHRLTRALCAGGLLAQDDRSERYSLGPLLVVLGRRAEQRLGYTRALPALERLAHDTGESVNLGIRSGTEVLVVLFVASPQPLRFAQASGTRVPVHTSAMGKVLLAFAADPPASSPACRPSPPTRAHDHRHPGARRRGRGHPLAGLERQRRGAQRRGPGRGRAGAGDGRHRGRRGGRAGADRADDRRAHA